MEANKPLIWDEEMRRYPLADLDCLQGMLQPVLHLQNLLQNAARPAARASLGMLHPNHLPRSHTPHSLSPAPCLCQQLLHHCRRDLGGAKQKGRRRSRGKGKRRSRAARGPWPARVHAHPCEGTLLGLAHPQAGGDLNAGGADRPPHRRQWSSRAGARTIF
jgi:hypothetical protein